MIATEKGITVDEEGFEKEMQQQKNRSRAAGILDTEDWIVLTETGSSKFVGYDNLKQKQSFKIPQNKITGIKNLSNRFG